MPKKKSRGGVREGSGRKPVEDKAVPITYWVKQSVVDVVGKEKLKEEGAKLAKRLYNKLK